MSEPRICDMCGIGSPAGAPCCSGCGMQFGELDVRMRPLPYQDD